MTDEHNHGGHGGHHGGGWEPLPQGDYDADATAFVKLPEGGLPDVPLAAPGHGYVPPQMPQMPQITIAPGGPAATDPAATGAWVLPPEVTGGVTGGGVTGEVRWPEPAGGPEVTPSYDHGHGHGHGHGHERGHEHEHGHDAGFGLGPGHGHGQGVTGQWNFTDGESHQAEPPAHEPNGAAGQMGQTGQTGQTGQWSIPVIAEGDLPDESGEFTTSSLAAQWGRTPPATLPGGAVAPWAAEEWAREEPSREPDELSHEGADEHAPEGAFEPEAAPEPEPVSGPAQDDVPVEEPAPAPEPVPVPATEPDLTPEAADATDHTDRTDRTDRTDLAEVTEVTEVPDPAPDEPASEAPAPEAAAPEAAPVPDAVVAPLHDDHPLASYVLRVNGTDRPVTGAWIGESLLYVLRERLGLAGAKDGCSQGECGACNVQVDGRLVASCLVPGATAAGSEVRTVEGLAADGQPSDVQRALASRCAVQCGFCVPGMAMTVHDLLEGNPAPTELETRQALCGNLCRCSGYRGILDAVQQVVSERETSSSTAAAGDSAAGDSGGGEARIPHQAGPSATEGIQDGGQA